MSELDPQDYTFDLSGGVLCLDFANTVRERGGEQAMDRLQRFRDLISWGRQTSVLDQRQAEELARASARHPRAAATARQRAIRLREAIYRLFAAEAGGRQPRAEDLAALNSALSESLPRLQLRRRASRFEWGWLDQPQALDRILWPVARSAAELLASDELLAVRVCAAATCGWLFMDRSRNHSRRWCDMKVCGNRNKARRHYQRSRATL